MWVAALSLSLSCVSISAEQWVIQGSLSHIEGKGVGYHRGYTTLELLTMPLCYDQKGVYPFLDLKAHGFDNRRLAANSGVGVRYALPTNYCLGVNLYYDITQGCHRNFNERGRTFSQLGCGFEAFGPLFDFRLNVYQPVGDRKWRARQLFVEDHDITKVKTIFKTIQAVPGFDAEIGRCLDRGALDCNLGWCLYGAAGTYFLNHPHKDNLWGGKLRLEASFNRYFVAELRTYYDKVSKGIVQIKIGLTMPFGNGADDSRCALLMPVERAEIMPLFSAKHARVEAVR